MYIICGVGTKLLIFCAGEMCFVAELDYLNDNLATLETNATWHVTLNCMIVNTCSYVG